MESKIFSTHIFYHGFKKAEFIELLNLAVKNCHFIFDGKYYDQIDGVAMGSPLGPLFANIFLSFHERKWLDDCPDNFKPVYFRRYVDDSFVLFESRDHIVLFLDYVNSKHSNIKFTFEIENDDQTLPFLDISIKRTDGKFETSVYRKSTFTGLFTNFENFLPISYKKGFIFSLLFRYFNICSSYQIFHAELDKFKKLQKVSKWLPKIFH